MPATDLTSWDPLFKEDYSSEIINDALQDENLIQKLFTSEIADDTWQGRYKLIPLRTGRNHSIGSIGPAGKLPTAGRTAYADYKVYMRDVYGRVQFDKRVMLDARNKKGAFASVMEQEFESLVTDMALRRNVMAWGTGSGVLAKVNGAHSSATTLEVKAPLGVTGTVNANRYLYGDANGGMFIAVVDGSTPTQVDGYATITAVNADGTDVTVDTALTVGDNDLVVIAQSATQNSYGKEPEGLLAMVDDGTYVATYHNLARASYPIVKSHVVSSVGALSLDAIQQPIDAVNIKVGGKGIDVLVCEHAVRRAYLALLEADRRYTGADLRTPDGGTAAAKKPSGKSITFGDIPMLVERDAPYGMIFGLQKSTFVRFYEDNGGWADEEGSVLKWVPDYDAYTAFYRLFENYHCHQPAKNFRMEGITVNQLIAHAF